MNPIVYVFRNLMFQLTRYKIPLQTKDERFAMKSVARHLFSDTRLIGDLRRNGFHLMVIGTDLNLLAKRIANTLRYEAEYGWKRELVLWLMVYDLKLCRYQTDFTMSLTSEINLPIALACWNLGSLYARRRHSMPITPIVGRMATWPTSLAASTRSRITSGS